MRVGALVKHTGASQCTQPRVPCASVGRHAAVRVRAQAQGGYSRTDGSWRSREGLLVPEPPKTSDIVVSLVVSRVVPPPSRLTSWVGLAGSSAVRCICCWCVRMMRLAMRHSCARTYTGARGCVSALDKHRCLCVCVCVRA